MITTRIIPVATATSQELLVEITENVCRPYCVNGSAVPSASVVFTASPSRIINGNAISTITATVTVVTPSAQRCGCAHTQVFTEKFDIAFDATGTNTVSITPGADTIVEPSNVKCCTARGVRLTTTITVAIA